jgi:hypothetical protein
MWPKLSSINKGVYDTITGIDNQKASQLNVWVRLFSGVGDGLIMVSNPDTKLFAAAGEAGIYGFRGNSKKGGNSGTLGYNWNGKPVNPLSGRSLRPSPMVTSMEFTEGEDQISRTGKISIKVFSLEQMEAIQQYFMEPGYHVFVDWGWNTNEGATGLTRVKTKDKNGNQISSTEIVNSASNDNLVQDKMLSKKIKSKGQYDSFLGFIVGGTVSGGGESFDINIEMRGTPQLPTYFQSHEVNYKKSGKNDNILAEQIEKPFGPQSLEEGEDSENTSDVVVKNRRFSALYNSLPSKRQIKEVKDLKNGNSFKYTDFINLDAVVQKSINSYTKNGFWATIVNFSTEAEETVEVTDESGNTKDFSIDRAALFSPEKYIRFEKAIEILNKNGGLTHFKVGSNEVRIELDISTVKIGAFPLIYSTKPETMVIPGVIPDFSKLLFNEGSINYNNPPTVNNSINGISFTGNQALNSDGLSDKQNYWGWLKNLYINIDMFENKITQSQKNIREILLDILNEMSSAVNGFWNFQIVEGEATDGQITFTVIDRNWIGENKSVIRDFYHDGEKSRFLDATLDIDIPGEMANQIIMKRNKISGGGQQAEIKVNNSTFFSNKTDKFMRKANFKGTEVDTESADSPPTTPPTEGSVEGLQQEVSDSKSNLESLEQEYQNNRGTISKLREAKSKSRRDDYPVTVNGTTYNSSFELQKDINSLSRKNQNITNEQFRERKNVREKEKELSQKKLDDKISAIEENIKKIEILPNPELKTEIDVGNAALAELLSSPAKTGDKDNLFRQSFRIYCLRDTNFLDILKKKKLSQVTGRLSHPLPIKYSFTILGNSGLQRGDTFNIVGIPRKYRTGGLFQVNAVTHTIEGMTWKTRVEGLYRQTQ